MSLDESNEETILEQALSFASVEERNVYLQRVCKGDSQLRAQVESLIAAHLGAGSFLSGAGGPPSGSISEAVPGTVVGRYKLLQQIGEGGMGVVYMAEQEEPVRRRVALKIIKLGMDTKSVVARFEAERQALALMDHPNIAKVLDGGATETGRPYFVMELVQGVPITEFCDKNKLSLQERLKLFIPVCQAVQSAHQKGIIHRDLKPTNILVTLNPDGSGHPMVIDFGVAKATNQKLTEKTVFTNFATMIGTPAYMSPEQAEMSRLDVDTRSDIYGLGVLLYELLTGTTPFPEKRLRSATYQEMQRIIMEEEPERPSTRLRQTKALTLDRDAPGRDAPPGRPPGSSARQDKTRSVTRSSAPLATDLDWIVMKCLEKDRTRRYETANGLAADLNRHLENEPVVARPPSNLYRFQKLVRRNKLAFAAGAMVGLALLVGMALAAWQAVRASRERDAKEAALRQAVAAQREQTRLRERAQAQAYASDMLLAQQAIAASNSSRARDLLYRHRPQSKSERDLRGWEWRYLWQQCTSDALGKVWQAPTKVSSLAVSSDGEWLATGQTTELTAVNLLELMGRTTARVATNIPARRGTDVFVAFSPTEPLLAFNSTEYSATNVRCFVCLWNIQNQQAVLKQSIRSFCAGLAFSPDGSKLLVAVMNHHGRSDSELLLLGVPDGTVLKEYDAWVSSPLPAIAVDSAFKFAAIGGDRLQVFDLATLRPRWSATNSQGWFWTSEFTKEGTVLITAEGDADSILQMRAVSSGKPVGRPISLPHGRVNSLALSPNGKTLASATADGTIQMWDVSDSTNLRSSGRPLRGSVSSIHGLAWLPDGKTLLSGGLDGSIYAWQGAPPQPDALSVVLTGVFAWHFAPDNRSLLTIDPHGRVWRREGHDFERATPVLDTGLTLVEYRDRVEFSDDATLLACSGDTLGAGREDVVQVWDLPSRASSPKLVTPGTLGVHGFAPGSHLLVLYNRFADSVEEWDLNASQKVRSWPKVLPFRNVFLLLALSTGGKYLLNASVDGDAALLRNIATGQTSAWNDLGAGDVSDVTFSPDGTFIALAGQRGWAQVWESASHRLLMTVGHQQLPISAVSFSPDGSRLMTGSDSPDAVTFWDLEGRELLTLQGPGNWTDSFDSPRFSADHNLLGRRTSQNELHVWSAPSWAEIETTEKTTPDSP